MHATSPCCVAQPYTLDGSKVNVKKTTSILACDLGVYTAIEELFCQYNMYL